MRHETANALYLVLVYLALFLISIIVLEPVHAETRDEIEQAITISAVEHGVDPRLAVAIAEVESRLQADAVGTLGELGLFQLRPEFHDVKPGATRENIDVATAYLAQLKRQCRAYGDAYFVCFNYGPARKLKWPHKADYYLKVKAVQRRRTEERYGSN
jgi:hypothetical protein